jgi:hypothetical protein
LSHVYYLDNLLSNVPVPASTPHCQFFTSNAIDRISNLDIEVSGDGSLSFGKLPVSKTCFLPTFSHICHFIVKTVSLSVILMSSTIYFTVSLINHFIVFVR